MLGLLLVLAADSYSTDAAQESERPIQQDERPIQQAESMRRRTGRREATKPPQVFYHIFVRSFRDSDGDDEGDLQGIEDSLEYLQQLGITSILLTPLYPSRFYHNYFADDFEGIDAEFGDMDDFSDLVKAVHDRGMKIFIDQEIHYVTGQHKWFTQSLNNPDSPFGDFVLYRDEANRFPQSGFFGIIDLPVWTGETIDHYTTNLGSDRVKKYFGDYFSRWVDPNQDGDFSDGVDGFRIDHMMDDLDNKGILTNLFEDFWAPLFSHLRKQNPDLEFIAEQADWTKYGEDYFSRGEVDKVFAFNLRNAIVAMDKQQLATAIERMNNLTSEHGDQLVFVENHDTDRFALDDRNRPELLRAAAGLNILVGWTPIVYYGQELGMSGAQKRPQNYGTDANDIGVREAFRWTREIEGEGTATWYKRDAPYWNFPFNKEGDGVSVEEQADDRGSLLLFYRSLIKLRQENSALSFGTSEVLPSSENTIAIKRSTGRDSAVLILNLTDKSAVVRVASGGAKGNFLFGDHSQTAQAGVISGTLPAYGMAVWQIE